jgi:hypothetical protein
MQCQISLVKAVSILLFYGRCKCDLLVCAVGINTVFVFVEILVVIQLFYLCHLLWLCSVK